MIRNLASGWLLLAAFAPAVFAVPSSEVRCGDFEAAIEGALKTAAMSYAKTIGDDSVPRQSNSELAIANDLHRIGLNFELMKAAGCPLPTEPITGLEYVADAVKCNTARLEASLNRPRGSTGWAEPLECNSGLWHKRPGRPVPDKESPAQLDSTTGRPVTLDKFNQVVDGMTLEDVDSIVGQPGKLASPQSMNPQIKEYVWDNPGSASHMKVTFQNGRVVAKQQVWLD